MSKNCESPGSQRVNIEYKMTKQDKTEHIPIMRIDTNLITLHRLLKLSKCLKNHGFKKSRRFGIWVKTLGRLKQYPFTPYDTIFGMFHLYPKATSLGLNNMTIICLII